ncbi:unnamed protein product [Clonostachys rhizophaga]|uniref:MgsA AAA+ ATPase C-terminal domain-containing protein n=1 Tax=Clonostachys rhizophaga TaxID=160324 RepID=A0A9N9YEU5_9HYPO|nr:unnamed protein product [Clonostachys rhizophaga]
MSVPIVAEDFDAGIFAIGLFASEDVGLADNTLLPLATTAYTATQQIDMPEASIDHFCFTDGRGLRKPCTYYMAELGEVEESKQRVR